MLKTIYIFRHDWKFAVKLIIVMLVVCGMSATCGAAWMWRAISDRPVRTPRANLVHAMVTPRLRVEAQGGANVAVTTAIEQAVQAEKLLENSKAIVQLQEQMANMQKDLHNLADTEAADRNALGRRIDTSDTRYSTFVGLVSGFGVLMSIVVGIFTILEFSRKRRAVPNYPVS